MTQIAFAEVYWGRAKVVVAITLFLGIILFLNYGVARLADILAFQMWPRHVDIAVFIVFCSATLYVGLRGLPFLPRIAAGRRSHALTSAFPPPRGSAVTLSRRAAPSAPSFPNDSEPGRASLVRPKLREHAITPPKIGSGVPQGANCVREWGWPVRQGLPPIHSSQHNTLNT